MPDIFPPEAVEAADELIKSGKYLVLFKILKAFRQGLVYGVKVRAPHALVLNLVWGSGPLRRIPQKVFQVTKTHAVGLALSSVIFTVVTKILRSLSVTVRSEDGAVVLVRNHPPLQWWHSAIGGFLVGYFMWGDCTSAVHQQMMMYMLSRILVALFVLFSAYKGFNGSATHYRVYSGCLWAALMVLLTAKPESLQASMRKSLDYVFLENDYFHNCRSLFLSHSTS